MATLEDYIKNIRKEPAPQPTPSEEQVEKAEAFDYITGRSGGNE